jgi:glycosyltransferase involved in cell wall biosynthesis
VDSLIVLIPAHNEATTIGDVVHNVRAQGVSEVIVVDDASPDDTAQVACEAGAKVVRLSLRLGAWGATQTGLRYASQRGFPIAVTMDADGQHPASGIRTLIEPLRRDEADVVIGAFPMRGSHARQLAWSYFRAMTGLKIQDLTSGFRAYNRSAILALSSHAATLLDYQDVGVLLMLRRIGCRMQEVGTPMSLRITGASRVFHSWFVVSKYMVHTSVLCLADVHLPPIRGRGNPR